MAEERLFVARDLVSELDRLGVGAWSPDAVRQWIREEPACPIAERGRRGQSHQYRLADVLVWLRERDARAARRQGSAETRPDPAAPAPLEVEKPLSADEVAAQARSQTTGDMELVSKMLQILEGRDPRNWKAAEEAMMTRLKRQQMQREVVPFAEMELALIAQQSAFLSAIQQLRSQLKLAARNASSGTDVVPAIDSEADAVLERLAGEPERYLQEEAA